jgi:hypothetical protein
LFGGILYIPIFIQTVVGQSATNSGLLLLPLMFGVGRLQHHSRPNHLAQLANYRACRAWPALIIATIALYLLSQHHPYSTTNNQIILDMIILGAGIGPSFPLLPMIAQNFFGLADTGVVYRRHHVLSHHRRAVGTAVLGTIFNNQLTTGLKTLPNHRPRPICAARHCSSRPQCRYQPAGHQRTHGAHSMPIRPVIKPAIDAYLDLAKRVP